MRLSAEPTGGDSKFRVFNTEVEAGLSFLVFPRRGGELVVGARAEFWWNQGMPAKLDSKQRLDPRIGQRGRNRMRRSESDYEIQCQV